MVSGLPVMPALGGRCVLRAMTPLPLKLQRGGISPWWGAIQLQFFFCVKEPHVALLPISTALLLSLSLRVIIWKPRKDRRP